MNPSRQCCEKKRGEEHTRFVSYGVRLNSPVGYGIAHKNGVFHSAPPPVRRAIEMIESDHCNDHFCAFMVDYHVGRIAESPRTKAGRRTGLSFRQA